MLAVLSEDYPKIRTIADSSQTDTLINYLITLLNIKVSNETEKKDLQIQMLVILDFIKSKHGGLTIPEVQEAFKMYVAREFADIKVFRMLDCVCVGEVLDAYKSFRADSLRVYSQKKSASLNAPKESTQEDKNRIREAFLTTIFEELKDKKYSSDAWLLFDELEKANLIKISNQDKDLQYRTEELRYIKELEDSRLKNPNSTVIKNDLNTAKDLIKQGKRLSIVKNKCRSIAVSEYLNRFTESFEKFKSVFQP